MIEDTLAERGKTHGRFVDNSAVSQKFKDLVASFPGWEMLPPIMKEAIHQDFLKLGRILCGDPQFVDHWLDRAGYNMNIVKYLEGANAIQVLKKKP